VGAAIGAGISYGAQVYNNYQNGMSGADAWRCVKVGDILIGAGAGAVAGAVGFVGAGFGAAVWGTSFWATVGTGAFSSILAGQYGRLAQLAFSGQWDQARSTLFRPGDMLLDAITGGLASAAGYKIGQLFKDLKGLGQWGVPDEFLTPQGLIDDIVSNELRGMRLTLPPEYNPNLPFQEYGSSLKNVPTRPGYTQIGPRALVDGRKEIVNTIVHEELHHRIWARDAFYPNLENYVTRIENRFADMKMGIFILPDY